MTYRDPYASQDAGHSLAGLYGIAGNERAAWLLSRGKGAWRQRVHLGNNGQGVNRQRVRLSGWADTGVNVRTDLLQWFGALADRLRYVRVCSGDWSRVCGPSVTFKHGMTAVFLDPPYNQDERDAELYRLEERVASEARVWAITNGSNPELRIALCGYEGEHDMQPDWGVYAWQSAGGFGSQGSEESRGKANRKRERVWFSPACLPPLQERLL